MLIIGIQFLLLVFAHALPAPDEVSHQRLTGFRGPFLSDPAERDFLISKLKRVWLLENIWIFSNVQAICKHANVKQDPEALQWLIDKLVQRCQVKLPSDVDDAPEIVKRIIDTILRFKKRGMTRKLFARAKHMAEICQINLKDSVPELHQDLAEKARITIDRIIPNFLKRKFGLERRDITPDKESSAYVGRTETHLHGLQPSFGKIGVTAEEAKEAYRQLLELENVNSNKEKLYQHLITVLSYDDSEMMNNLLKKYSVGRMLHLTDHDYELFADKDFSIDYSESQMKKVINDIRSSTSNPANYLWQLSHVQLPTKNHPRSASMARLVVDLAIATAKENDWSSDQLKILLEFGVVKDFMREDSDFQLIESGLTGPAWEVMQPLLSAEFIVEHEFWLASNCNKFDELDASTISDICRGVPGIAFKYVLQSFADNLEKQHTVYGESEWVDFKKIDTAQKVRLSSFLFYHPKYGRVVFDGLLQVRQITLKSIGGADTSFDDFTASTIATDYARLAPLDLMKKLSAERNSITGTTKEDILELDAAHIQFFHGRTAYLHESGKVIKFEKKDKNELQDEMQMDLFLQNHRAHLKLTSQLPENPVLYNRVKLDVDVADKLSPGGADYELEHVEGLYHRGLKFDAPEGYSVPLHKEDTLQGLIEASEKSLGDAAVMAKKFGLVSVAPADLFHNLENGRRYQWNIDMHKVYEKLGAGRLDQWRKAVRHVNMGRSGIRDLKHYKFLTEITNPSGSLVVLFLENLGNFVFSWMLSVGEWFVTHDFEVNDLQSVLTQGLSNFISQFAGKSLEQCTSFAVEALHLDRLARQMKYFMGKEYVDDVNNNRKIPADIYDIPMEKIIMEKPDKYWNEKDGWMRHEGEEDLGPYNGPFPITEMIRTLHIVLTTSMNLE